MSIFKRSKSGRFSRSSSVPASKTAAKSSRLDSNGRSQESHLQAAIPPPQAAPICNLPLEIIQHIATYLSSAAAASFSLSSRYIYYALGTDRLSLYLTSPRSKLDRRRNIEILERAFPSHWYCAWCDKFHAHERDGGPKRFEREEKRNCAEFNSYLHSGRDYMLCYHHIRLAMNRELWGGEYGIPPSAFNLQQENDKLKIGKSTGSARLECEARVVSGHFLLHATYHLTLSFSPTRRLQPHTFLSTLYPALPHVVVGHRNSHSGHTGLRSALESALARNWKYDAQLCYVCATDYAVSCTTTTDVLPSTPTTATSLQSPTTAQHRPHLSLCIEVWRDLGSGRNPFDASWRAHGELGRGVEGCASDAMRLTGLQTGDIKRAFESGRPIRRGVVELGADRTKKLYEGGASLGAGDCTEPDQKSGSSVRAVLGRWRS